MTVHANVQVKDEEILLKEVIPIWKTYPVDHWVFYNDNSSDRTVEVINDLLGSAATILTSDRIVFNESHNRSAMLEHSRDNNANFVIAIDADELMSDNMVKSFDRVLELNSKYNIHYYWFNVVDSLGYIRQDPLYVNNFRTFILPLGKTAKFDMSQWKYHTPRCPPVSLPSIATKDIGFIHLQSINRQFYALKQLWYKHFEHKEYNHSVEQINNRYDPVVNKLNFQEIKTPDLILGDIKFDAKVYNDLAEIKGYKKYILENRVEELITFGGEYL
jgi:hypothetical protein